jgi:UTP-glucose-1-phosphate uridylyltransferase
MRAVIPAAGKGTRMHSVTGGSAKELLPLGESRVMDHVLDVAHRCCQEAVVVWDPAKGTADPGWGWVTQMPLAGLAPAIASGLALDMVNLVLLPDAVFTPLDPALSMSVMGEGEIILALAEVSDEDVSKYGICEVDANGWITRMVEKPQPNETESRWAISARYLLRERASNLLVEMVTARFGQPGEMDMSPFFAEVLRRDWKIAAHFIPSTTKRFDCGDPDGYLEALEVFREKST